jgi:hypothetical protein
MENIKENKRNFVKWRMSKKEKFREMENIKENKRNFVKWKISKI